MESFSDIVKFGNDIVKCGEMCNIDSFPSNLIMKGNLVQSDKDAIRKVLTLEDTLLEILTNLDEDSIKTAALVCKRWNEVISSSPVIMDRFCLMASQTLSSSDQDWKQPAPKRRRVSQRLPKISTRKYLNVALSYCDCHECFKFNFCFETSQIRVFSIHVGYFHSMKSWSKLASFLSHMPNLESLSIHFEQERASYDSSFEIVLQKLKRLSVILKCSIGFFDFFNVKNLTELDVSRTSKFLDRDIYINFLKQAQNLKSWTLHDQDSDLFEHEEKFPFLLETLNIKLVIKSNQHVEMVNFEKFLIDQMSTITELLIACTTECLKNETCLKTLIFTQTSSRLIRLRIWICGVVHPIKCNF